MTQAPGRGWGGRCTSQPSRTLSGTWDGVQREECVCGVWGSQGHPPSKRLHKAAPHCCSPQDSRSLLAVTHGHLDLLGYLYDQPQKLFSIRRGVSLWSGHSVRIFRHHFLPAYGNTSPNIIVLKCTHPLDVRFIENHIFIYIYMSIF